MQWNLLDIYFNLRHQKSGFFFDLLLFLFIFNFSGSFNSLLVKFRCSKQRHKLHVESLIGDTESGNIRNIKVGGKLIVLFFFKE